jgi:hypothetical protein
MSRLFLPPVQRAMRVRLQEINPNLRRTRFQPKRYIPGAERMFRGPAPIKAGAADARGSGKQTQETDTLPAGGEA